MPLRAALLSGLLLLGAWAGAENAPAPLVSISKEFDLKKVTATRASIGVTEVEGKVAFEVVTEAGKDYPGVLFPAPVGVWDLSDYAGVEATVKNTGEEPESIVLRVDNAGDWRQNPWSGEALHGLKPGATGTIKVTFGKFFGGPGYPLDPAAVTNVQLFGGKTATPRSFAILDIRPFGTAADLAKTRRVYKDAPAGTPLKQQLVTFDEQYEYSKIVSSGGGKAEKSPVAGSLRVNTPAMAFWPGIRIPGPNGTWDLSAYEYVSVDVHNVDTHDIDVYVQLNSPGSDGLKNCVTERAFLQPDQRTTVTVPIERTNASAIRLFGMVGYPQGLYSNQAGVDPEKIVSITIFTPKDTAQPNLIDVSNIYAGGPFKVPGWLAMTPKQFFPILDAYGQFRHKEWPGKIQADADLQRAREDEANVLAADNGPATWNKWGGWAQGPQLEATGHFRTAKHNGKWWLVDPDGRLFFSVGITCVSFGWAATPVEDRPNWFTNLPPNEGAIKEFYTKSYKLWSGHYAGREPQMFDFSSYNLLRKYGENWRTVYPNVVHQRLRHWGINTIANWSGAAFTKLGKTPYTGTFYYSARKLRTHGSGFPDPFDPNFAKNVQAGARQWISASANDPWCIGYFVDNEMPWGGDTALAEDALKAMSTQPAKIEMARWLDGRYEEIEDLNAAWDTKYASWDDLIATPAKTIPRTPEAVKDLTDFNGLIAVAYFKTVREAIKTFAPNKLYLGCRCVGGGRNVIEAAAKYNDVVSYNRYCHSVRDVTLPEGIDAPMLIGEFHFGANDRGLFGNGLVSADDQADRGKKYAAYVNSALDNPQMVGVHWFQYGDESATGRGDGENHQIGFVDVCDTPYAETIQASRQVAEAMYTRRLANR